MPFDMPANCTVKERGGKSFADDLNGMEWCKVARLLVESRA